MEISKADSKKKNSIVPTCILFTHRFNTRLDRYIVVSIDTFRFKLQDCRLHFQSKLQDDRLHFQSKFQHIALGTFFASCSNLQQLVATCCNLLQLVATYCKLQLLTKQPKKAKKTAEKNKKNSRKNSRKQTKKQTN